MVLPEPVIKELEAFGAGLINLTTGPGEETRTPR